MISSNTRASRSRYSSPAQPQNGKSDWNGTPLEAPKSTGGTAASRSFMKNWLEPSVQNKASFEEAGLMRYGVLETMAPLGSLPKPKKAGSGEGEKGPIGVGGGHGAGSSNGVKKIILRPSGSGSGGGHASTPNAREASPKLSATPPLELAAASPVRKPLPTSREEDDEEYDPKGSSQRRHRERRTSLPKKSRLSAGASSLKRPLLSPDKSSAPEMSPTPVGAAAPAEANEAEPVVQTPTQETPDIEPKGKSYVDKVIEAAVDEALKHFRYPTAYALRILYDEKADDEGFVTMIESIFSQTADEATEKEFARLLEAKKVEGKRDNQGWNYFDGEDPAGPPKAKTAPYAKLVLACQTHPTSPAAVTTATPVEEAGEKRATKKIKVTHHHHQQHQADRTPRKTASTTMGIDDGKDGKTSGLVKTPGSRRKTRRSSASSDSSLSSAMSLSSPEVPTHRRSPTRGAAQPATRGRPSLAARETIELGPTKSQSGSRSHSGSRSRSRDAPKPTRPISTRGKSHAAARPSGVCQSLSPTSHARQHSSSSPFGDVAATGGAASATMPSRVSELFPNLPVKKGKAAQAQAQAQAAAAKDDQRDKVKAEVEATWSRRRNAQKVTNDYTALESSVREDGFGGDWEMATPTRVTRSGRQSLGVAPGTRSTRQSNKRAMEEDDLASPTTLSAQGEASSVVASRATTPSGQRPAAKRPRSGVRIKSSPVKKKGGTAAGLPRGFGETPGTGTGTPRDASQDNEDFCSACGNQGEVVCCETCIRSFHLECIGIEKVEDIPGEWYCNECVFKHLASRLPVHKGSFASALNILEKTNHRAFALPSRLQNRYEGVRAGVDGDYEDILAAANTNTRLARKKNGYEEAPDFYKQRDEGQAVLCHECQQPAANARAIIPCSACPYYWHIDCLDPPLAVPPVLKNWKCPAHVDDVLSEAPPLAPAHRFRKLKNGTPIVPAFSRGLKNNGHIEVDWSEELQNTDHSGWPEPESFGRAYKVPAKGIVLDFIEQLRKKGSDCTPDPPVNGNPVSDTQRDETPSNQVLAALDAKRSVAEMQASVNLLSLRQGEPTGVDQLTAALMASADKSVLAVMAQGSVDKLAPAALHSADATSLRAMLAQIEALGSHIRARLNETDEKSRHAPSIPAVDDKDRNSISTPESVDIPPSVHKPLLSEPTPADPVTEPTPPSTVDQAEGSMELD